MTTTNRTPWTPGLTPAQAAVLAAYIKAGYVAHFYPRKKTIALNGFPGLPVVEACKRMGATLDRINSRLPKGE